MIEPEMDEPLPFWPKWLNTRNTISRAQLRFYRGGHWTYSNGYVFLIEGGRLSYRKLIKTIEQHNSWTSKEWVRYGTDYDPLIDPIMYVMENLL